MCNIIYEDNHLLVVVKEQNVPTQLDSSEDKDFLSMLKAYIKEKYNKPGNVYLGLVHRLDRPTGGVMVFARNSKSAERLCKQIKDGEMNKQYLAVVHGTPRIKQNRIVSYLKKDEKTNTVKIAPKFEEGAKEAILDYEVLESKNDTSLVRITLHTGRSHQIRVQMASIGHSLVNDVKYGDSKERGNLALYAFKLQFTHPTTKNAMTFIVSPPQDRYPWNLYNLEKYISINK